MIVTAADQEAANGYAASIDPDIGGDRTFSIPLSATGAVPATHYATDTVVTIETLEQIAALQAAEFPMAMIHRGHHDFDHESEINRYTFDEVLAEAGLARMEVVW